MSRSLATRLLVVPAALLSLTVGLVGAAGVVGKDGDDVAALAGADAD